LTSDAEQGRWTLTNGSRAYEITLRGAASDLIRTEFEDTQVVVVDNVTCLRTGVVDQSTLYGLIRRVEALGLVLLGVGVIEPS
jgi:hypothetical protein